MGYLPHEMFETPSDNTTIWRYLPIEQLLGILNESTLYFTNPRTLEDKLEGSYPDKTYFSLWDSINLLNEKLPIKKGYGYEFQRKNHNESRDTILRSQIHISNLTKDMSNLIFCNYWTASDKEMATHWWRYGGNPTTVAIKSTIGRLRKSFLSEANVHIGKINYINYESDHTWNYEKIMKSEFNDNNCLINLIYSLYLNKDEKYEDESEVRCVLSYENGGEYIERIITQNESLYDEHLHLYIKNLTSLNEIPIFDGNWGPPWVLSFTDAIEDLPFNFRLGKMNIDLKQLIEEIIVSPRAQSYFKRTLQQTIEKYGLKRNIVRESDIP